MSLLTPTWHKLAGATRWILCRKVKADVALHRLNICRRCPTAEVRKALGLIWLSCGEPGEDHEAARDPSCGCVLGLVPRRDTASVAAIPNPENRRKAALALLRPKGKTRCNTTCPQGRW